MPALTSHDLACLPPPAPSDPTSPWEQYRPCQQEENKQGHGGDVRDFKEASRHQLRTKRGELCNGKQTPTPPPAKCWGGWVERRGQGRRGGGEKGRGRKTGKVDAGEAGEGIEEKRMKAAGKESDFLE